MHVEGGKKTFSDMQCLKKFVSLIYILSHELNERCVPSKQDICCRREVKGISKMFVKGDPRLLVMQQVQAGVGQRPSDRNI